MDLKLRKHPLQKIVHFYFKLFLFLFEILSYFCLKTGDSPYIEYSSSNGSINCQRASKQDELFV